MEKIKIRKAQTQDSGAIADCFLLAMGDIACQLIGKTDLQQAHSFLNHFTQLENNQYSYQNCWVAEVDGAVAGVANVYDGARLSELRRPVFDFINNVYHKDVLMEDETAAGEFYIDCIGVIPSQQGKGIGTSLLKFLITEFVVKKHQTLGLLVDKDNPNAKKLYCKLGFQVKEDKCLVGKQLEHLQYSSDPVL